MKAKLFILAFVSTLLISMSPKDFIATQMSFERVKVAQKHKNTIVNDLLKSKGINSNSFDLFLRAFKTEKTLEVWAKNKTDKTYQLITTYEHCASSGILGPKRRSGDRQTPEGFYTVDFFNPTSQYFLSFRINYPNASDKIFADPINPGDNVFIHGNCVTIGCIPIGDDKMEELYLLAIRARNYGEINVHVFPNKMDDAGMAALKAINADATIQAFWSNIKTGYDVFETTKSLPKISVAADGFYVVK